MFSASLVRRAFEMKAAFLQCRQHFHPVSLIELNARFPPDTVNSFELQFRYSIRDLKHYKNCLKSDAAIVYSSKDAENEASTHPRTIKVDLETAGFQCWFSETPNLLPFDSLILALKSSKVILFCMSDNFVQDDICTKAFNYVKRILKKPYILLITGQSNIWKKSEIGAMVTDEVYVKLNKSEHYKARIPELIEQIKKKSLVKLNMEEKPQSAQCFISYCHANSHDAIAKGALLKNDFCLGKYDPRSISEYLNKAGYSTWIDTEQVGGKGTLFKDIVDGIRNSKVVIACVSNEYAESENCMREYRFSANLKKPIIICIFGSPKAYIYWRNTELGLVSCLNKKEINFQIENPDAYADLVNELKNLNIEADKNVDMNKNTSENVDEILNEREIQYSELSELVQRKFLRQIAGYTSSLLKPFPRLFVLDIYAPSNLAYKWLMEDLGPNASLSLNREPSQFIRQERSLKKSKSVDLQNNMFCVRVLCEHENGWVSRKFSIYFLFFIYF